MGSEVSLTEPAGWPEGSTTKQEPRALIRQRNLFREINYFRAVAVSHERKCSQQQDLGYGSEELQERPLRSL